MKIEKIQINNGGYAIFFAVVVVSIISVIMIGFSNSSYKQLILSSLATDSQLAFYQADSAAECALYADTLDLDTLNNPAPPWECGKFNDTNYFSFDVKRTGNGGNFKYDFKLVPGWNSTEPCFNFDIVKGDTTTEISARGYNSCNLANIRTVERGIKVSY